MSDLDLMRVIDQAAKLATTGAWQQGLDARDRYEIAWQACAETAVRHYLDHDEVPYPSLLVGDGMRAVGDEVYAITRARGLRPDSARAHAAYWWDIDRGHGVRADLGVERIALHQALDRLDDEQRDDLTLVAATGTVRAAAEAAGVSYKHMAARVRAARVAFYGLWFNPETPPVPPVIKVYAEKKATCVRGHSREAWNVYASTGACRQCRAEKYAAKKAERLAVGA